MDDTGKVIYFIHSPSNVTELYKLSQREQAGVEALKQQRLQLHELLCRRLLVSLF